MTPHRTLPIDEVLHRIDMELSDIGTSLKKNDARFKKHDGEFKFVRDEIKGLHKKFDQQDRKLETWKSQLFDKIDNFLGRIDSQDKEIAAIGFRKEEHEDRISKLEGYCGINYAV